MTCMLEALEARMLLATVTWDGGAGTDSWHDAMNWSTDVLPGPDDDVIIDAAGDVTIQFTAGSATINALDNHEKLNLSGGSLNVSDDWIQRDVMTMTGGTADADLVVQAGLDWSGGTIRGNKTSISPAAYIQITDDVTLETLLTNFGVFSWTDGNIVFNGAVINNQGLATVSSDGTALEAGGLNLFANNANMTRQNAGGADTQTTFDIAFTSGGSLAITSGALRLNAVSRFLGGSVTTLADATLRIFGDDALFGSSATVSSSGVLAFAGGHDHVFRSSINELDQLLVINGADLSLTPGGTIGNLDLDGLVHSVSQTLTITERFRIFGGILHGSATLRINDGALMTIDADQFDLQLDMAMHGQFILKSGTWTLNLIDVTNHADMFLRSGEIRTATDTSVMIVNEAGGVITKHTAASVDISSPASMAFVTLVNRGSIHVNEGTLTLAGGGSSDESSLLQVDTDATLSIDRNFSILGTAIGGGTVRVTQGTVVDWYADIADLYELIIDDDAKVTLGGSDGTLHRAMILGELSGVGGNLVIHERLDLVDGRIDGSGLVTIGAHAVFAIKGPGSQQSTDVVNNGTIILNDGDWHWYDIDVTNNADFFIRAGNVRATGDSTFHNTGVITKHTQATAHISAHVADDVHLNNLGTMRVNEGTLRVAHVVESSGLIRVKAAGTIAFEQGGVTIGGGAFIGTGTVIMDTPTDWHAGTVSVGELHVTRNLTLLTASAKTLDVDALVIDAGFVWIDGTLDVQAGTVSVTGTLRLDADDLLSLAVSSITIHEGGRLLQVGTNIANFGSTSLQNDGLVRVSGSGSLLFDAGSIQNLNVNNSLILGTWDVAGGGTLDFGEQVIKNFAERITLSGHASEFVSLGGMTESSRTIFIRNNYALQVQGNFLNKATIEFDSGGSLHVDGDYLSGAGSTTRFDVSDINGGIVFATGHAQLGGLYAGSWSTTMNDPPEFIRLVNASSVSDASHTAEFDNPPPGFFVELDFEHPFRARIKFTPF